MKTNIEYQRFYLALSKTKTITLGSLATALLFFALMQGHIPAVLLGAWLAYFFAQQLLRQWVSQHFLKTLKHDADYIAKRVKQYQVFVFLSAAGWGSIGPLYFLGGNDVLMVAYVLAFSIGVLAGGIFSMASIPRYFYTFVIALEVPIIVAILWSGYIELALIALLFLFFSIQSGREVQRSVLKNLELNEKNAKLIEGLKAADQLKSQFLANMSHEIRTPMNAIMGYIQVLEADETHPEKREYLQTINRSGHDLLHIINDILDFSKIENRELTIEQVPFSPQKRITQAVKLFQPLAEKNNLKIRASFDEGLPSQVLSDSTRIIQVLNNLLSNAIKFSPENSTVNLNVQFDKVSSKLKVCVRDEGLGISPAQQVKVFQAFNQADNSDTRAFGGTGLGLSICAGLMEMLDGKMSLESQLGVGSEFCFSLPVDVISLENTQKRVDPDILTFSSDESKPALQTEQAEKTEKVEPSSSTPQPAIENKPSLTLKGHVLVVEDNLVNQLLLCKLLTKAGLTFDLANDGLEAVKQFQTNQYSLILMDENMPNMSGIEATQEILRLESEANLPHTPIIAVTANALKGDQQRFLAAGMDDYLAKPIKVGLLYQTLQKNL